MFLPLYRFEPETGLWLHRERPQPAALGLDDLSYSHGTLEYRSVSLSEPVSVLEGYLEQARKLAAGIGPPDARESKETVLTDELESLRWFPLS